MSETCKGLDWKSNQNFKDKYGLTRYWYDCAKFYFDGTYNVIELPEGFSMYHGSIGLVWTNVAYPLGIGSYDPGKHLSRSDIEILNDPNISTQEKLKLINGKINYFPGWYGDLQTAMVYSMDSNIQLQDIDVKCGPNCVLAFKSIKKMVFVDIYDPLNLKILLADKRIPEKLRTVLGQSQVLGGRGSLKEARGKLKDLQKDVSNDPVNNFQHMYDPLRRFVGNTHRVTIRQPGDDPYEVPKFLIDYFVKKGYAGYVNPKSPYASPSGVKGKYRFSEIVFGDTVLDYIERDVDNNNDWQHPVMLTAPPTIKKLYSDMMKYKTTNLDFHAGDLLPHSIWTMFYADEMYMERGCTSCEWGSEIPQTEGIRKLINIASFLHDIGKAGDEDYLYYSKPDHPKDGGEYLMGYKDYVYSDRGENKTLDVSNVLSEVGLDGEQYLKIVACLVTNHWLLGEHLKRLSEGGNLVDIADEYVSTIKASLLDFGLAIVVESPNELDLFLKIQMLISAADVKATQPYLDHNRIKNYTKKLDQKTKGLQIKTEAYRDVARDYKKNINYKSQVFDYLSNLPQTHPGGTKYQDFRYDEEGLRLRREILKQI